LREGVKGMMRWEGNWKANALPVMMMAVGGDEGRRRGGGGRGVVLGVMISLVATTVATIIYLRDWLPS